MASGQIQLFLMSILGRMFNSFFFGIHGLAFAYLPVSVSRIYLELAGWVLRRAPRSAVRKSIAHKFCSLDFRRSEKLRLAPKSVRLTHSSKLAINLHPHPGEFDFGAQFNPVLGYEEEVFDSLAERIMRYDAIIEIGANVGVYSLYLASARKDMRVPVYCFEPSLMAAKRWLENSESNPHIMKNVFLIPAAVGNKCSLRNFYEPHGHLTNGSLEREFASKFAESVSHNIAPCISGDELHALIRDYHQLLIKIDAEGAELEVLESLNTIIMDKKPDLLIEVLPQYDQSLGRWAKENKDYRLFCIADCGLKSRDCVKYDPNFRDCFLTADRS